MKNQNDIKLQSCRNINSISESFIEQFRKVFVKFKNADCKQTKKGFILNKFLGLISMVFELLIISSKKSFYEILNL